jgi:hypothetical protein
VVVAIASYTVGREAFTLALQPKQAVFDLDEAVDFVADELPFEVAAQLSHDDVRRMLEWHLEHLRDKGVPPDATTEAPGTGAIVVADDESVEHVTREVDAAGLDATREDVRAVLEAELKYLAAIGAIGPRVDGPDDPG